MSTTVSDPAGEGATRPRVQWRLRWESQLTLADHTELSDFFRNTYGPTGAFNTKSFEGARSWAGARPELRAIAYDDRGVAAHIGALRRFIKVGKTDLLVAELGLYGVRPDLEGLGISHSIRVMYPALRELDVPFGFGSVRPALQKHITRLLGRQGLGNILIGVRVKSTHPDVYLNLPPTRVDEDVLVLVLPIARPMGEWPNGTMIDRNGPEL
ncbi:acyltransferase [Bradyrhizobium lablabi]|uniref:Nodulation protein A n=2 Tax=Bradyrhizobium lablabi TaxID=722472 RepID=A0A0R3MBX1_9BRAD|nr:NodA family N-acyltransferase [Bradyrhizobium lablabi]KRR17577.1 acyltransferase [Bradyrhizobium lablabi]